MALTAAVRAGISAEQTNPIDLGTGKIPIELAAVLDFTDGTGAGQVSKVWSDRRTLAASATENLDLAGGVTDAFGNTLTFATIKGIMIKAADANVNDVVVGGAGSNTFVGPFADATDKIKVRPGGVQLNAQRGTGWTVTAGTGDILLMANGAGSTEVVYEIVIVGT